MSRAANAYLASGGEIEFTNDPSSDLVSLGLIEGESHCESDGELYWVKLNDTHYKVFCTYHSIGELPPYDEEQYTSRSVKFDTGDTEKGDLKGQTDGQFILFNTNTKSDFIAEAEINIDSMQYGQLIGFVYRFKDKSNVPSVSGNSFAVRQVVKNGSTVYEACFSRVKSGHYQTNEPSFTSIEVPTSIANDIASGNFTMNIVAKGAEQNMYINRNLVLSVNDDYNINNDNIGVGATYSKQNTQEAKFLIPSVKIYDLP